MSAGETNRTIEATFRLERARLIAGLARAALTLRVVGGLSTDEIARAFLSSEATIAQRIVRAKKTIAKAGLTFEVPRGAERAARLSSVLEVIYLIFNEGYAATLTRNARERALLLARADTCGGEGEVEVAGDEGLTASRLGARGKRRRRTGLRREG